MQLSSDLASVRMCSNESERYSAPVLQCYSASVLQCYSASVLQCYSASVLHCFISCHTCLVNCVPTPRRVVPLAVTCPFPITAMSCGRSTPIGSSTAAIAPMNRLRRDAFAARYDTSRPAQRCTMIGSRVGVGVRVRVRFRIKFSVRFGVTFSITCRVPWPTQRGYTICSGSTHVHQGYISSRWVSTVPDLDCKLRVGQ